LVAQLRNDAIPLFKQLHPGCKLVFMFDNSSNHHAREPGTPSADQLNLSDGGKNVVNFKNTSFRGSPFQMQHIVDGKVVQKGVKTLLIERGDWSDDLILDCSNSKVRNNKHAEEGSPDFNRCCGRRRLSLHEDFQNTKCWLEAVMDDYEDCELIFLPKFHCELNFIERVWGYCKASLRLFCTFRFEDLQRMLPETLDSIPLHFFRRAARSCFRWMSGYREGLVGPFLDYIMKKYTSHRCVPNFASQPDLKAAYEQLFLSTQTRFTPSGEKVDVKDSAAIITQVMRARMKELEKRK
jgi:transposase